MKRLGFVLIMMLSVIALLVAGCGGGEEATPTATESPGATSTPEATATPGETEPPSPTQPPGPGPTFAPGEIDPVSFNELIPFLPDTPSGWEADEAFGMTQTLQGFSWSQASRDYTHKTTDEYVDVVIFDSAYYTGFGWLAAWEYAFEWESTDGYARTITFEGYPAWKIYDKPDSYTLMVFVADRFMVMTNAETEASLNQFANAIDYSGIAAL